MGERKTFVLAPKAHRGLFTAWSRFSMGELIDSFSAWRDTIIRDNAWVGAYGHLQLTLATGGGLGTGPVWAIYFYNAIDTASSSALPVSVFLGHVGGTLVPGGTAVLGRYDINAAILSTTAPHELSFLTIKNRCFVAGPTLTGGSVPTIITKYPTATSYPWGKAAPTAVLAYTPYTGLSTGDHPEIKVYYRPATTGTGIQTTTGAVAIASAGAGSFITTTWDGKTLLVNSGSETYTINAITSATAGTLTTNATQNRGPDAAYEVHYGRLRWGSEPPKYAYSYYNPVTGHSTSRSPVLRLSEQDMTDVGVELTNIPTTNDANYTRIILWRSEVNSGGSTLYPLKLDSAHGGSATITDGLIVNGAVGTVTYRDNQPDTELGQVIGNFTAPTRNDPPPADIKFMEYWDGRVFFNTVAAPWRIRYSERTSSSRLGVGEESFPADNFLDVPSDNGVATGLKVVGGTLLIGTDRFLYAVPNNYESGAPLVKVSSRGGGVGHFAIDDHPGDTLDGEASAIYVSRDKRLWRHYLSGRLDDIGAPIQDKLNAAVLTYSKPYIVKVFQREKNWLCAVGIRGANDRYDFYFFDFDAKCWYDLAFAGGVTNVLSIGAGINFTLGGIGYAIMGDTSGQVIHHVMGGTVTMGTPIITTQFLDMGDTESKKTLEEIVFYVSDASLADWGCAVRFDGSTGAFTTLTQTAGVASSPRYRGPGILRFDAKALGPKQWSSMQLKLTIGGPATSVQASLYKVEIFYRMASTGAPGKPSG
jgi:hypothetical protein